LQSYSAGGGGGMLNSRNMNRSQRNKLLTMMREYKFEDIYNIKIK
jgi:predicted kinase